MSKISDLIAAAGVLRAFDKVPEYEKILDAVQTITELTAKLEEEKEKVRRLEKEIADIKTDQIDANKVTQHGDYFMQDGVTLCSRCWTVDQRRGQVVHARNSERGRIY